MGRYVLNLRHEEELSGAGERYWKIGYAVAALAIMSCFIGVAAGKFLLHQGTISPGAESRLTTTLVAVAGFLWVGGSILLARENLVFLRRREKVLS